MDVGTDLLISAGSAAATVLLLRVRARLRGEYAEVPPAGREFLAYFAAYIAGFAALEYLAGPLRPIAVIVLGALAFSVTLNGPEPIWSKSYLRLTLTSLAVALSLAAIYLALKIFGIDLAQDDFTARP